LQGLRAPCSHTRRSQWLRLEVEGPPFMVACPFVRASFERELIWRKSVGGFRGKSAFGMKKGSLREGPCQPLNHFLGLRTSFSLFVSRFQLWRGNPGPADSGQRYAYELGGTRAAGDDGVAQQHQADQVVPAYYWAAIDWIPPGRAQVHHTTPHHTTPGCFGRQCPSAPLLPLALSPPTSLLERVTQHYDCPSSTDFFSRLNQPPSLQMGMQRTNWQQVQNVEMVPVQQVQMQQVQQVQMVDVVPIQQVVMQVHDTPSHSKKFITPPACMPCACPPASSPASASLQRKHSMPTDVIPDCPRAVAQL